MSSSKHFTRKDFLQTSGLAVAAVVFCSSFTKAFDFSDKPFFNLKPIGRQFSLEGYYIWCSSPIWGDDGKVHLFYSRWKKKKEWAAGSMAPKSAGQKRIRLSQSFSTSKLF
ncbi:hypothetical protein [Epilithonimonas sp. UC225_85]|uniref:hypothetical protein n=1 Tax=Epilithonimonas sp. UC225_85 TaxID=3350167 RepID=UPI0036D27974